MRHFLFVLPSVYYYQQLTIQLALMGFAEFVLHLTRMNPDMIYLHQDCGYINISYFKFDIDDQSGKAQAAVWNDYCVRHCVFGNWEMLKVNGQIHQFA